MQHQRPKLTLITVDNSFKVLRGNFDWDSLANKKIVDIGGGNGHVSIDLARVRVETLLVPWSN